MSPGQGQPLKLVLFLSLLLAACSRPDAKPRIRIATLAGGVGQLPMQLANSLGYFADEGLAVELDELSSTSKTMQALVGNSADVSVGTFEQTLQAVAAGRDLKCFFVLFTSGTLVLAAAPGRPQITRVEDLKGRTVGVTGLGSASQSNVSMLMSRHGLTPADFTPEAIGTAATAIAAVENGKVDAAILNSLAFETLRSRRPDIKVLVDLRTAEGTAALYGVPMAPVVVAASTSRWLAENPDTARRITRALARASRYIRERPAAEIAAILPPSLKTPSSDAALRTVEIALPAFSRDGSMPSGGPDAILNYLKLAVDPSLNVDVSRTYTTEFLGANP